MLITPIRGLITLLTKSPDPPSMIEALFLTGGVFGSLSRASGKPIYGNLGYIPSHLPSFGLGIFHVGCEEV